MSPDSDLYQKLKKLMEEKKNSEYSQEKIRDYDSKDLLGTAPSEEEMDDYMDKTGYKENYGTGESEEEMMLRRELRRKQIEKLGSGQ